MNNNPNQKYEEKEYSLHMDDVRSWMEEWTEQIHSQLFSYEYVFFFYTSDGKKIDNSITIANKNQSVFSSIQWNKFTSIEKTVVSCAESNTTIRMELAENEQLKLPSSIFFALPIFLESYEFSFILALVVLDKDKDQFPIPFISSSLKNFLLFKMEEKKNTVLENAELPLDIDARKRDMLFQATKQLHAKFHVDSVLSDVIDYMKEMYPEVHIELFLSQESPRSVLPVKLLDFHPEEQNICTRAFMKGKIITEPNHKGLTIAEKRVAAPLCGKQGVYGVLLLESELDSFDTTDIRFISILADTAGTAFENAKLYEQSIILIDELRLINEITLQLSQSLKLEEIFNFVMSELLKIYSADFCAIFRVDPLLENMVVQASNVPDMLHRRIDLDHGFSGKIYETKEPIILSDYNNNEIYSEFMDELEARSLIASPIQVNSEVMGVIFVAHNQPNYFSYENYKLLEVLSGHIGLAIMNASLHAEVRRMAITDHLTGLFVRNYLDEQINISQEEDEIGTIIVSDIDNFKKINDTYGHQVGDEVLKQVCKIIKSSIRDTDIAARWGGEELAVYLRNTPSDHAAQIAERIRSRVYAETLPRVTVSCGLSQWRQGDESSSVETLFYQADMALYEAKDNGKNQVRVKN